MASGAIVACLLAGAAALGISGLVVAENLGPGGCRACLAMDGYGVGLGGILVLSGAFLLRGIGPAAGALVLGAIAVPNLPGALGLPLVACAAVAGVAAWRLQVARAERQLLQ